MNQASPILFISSKAPRGAGAPLACLESAMTTAVFGVPVQLVLLGDGVLQLLQAREPAPDVRNLSRMFGALGLYGIDTLYVDEAGLRRYGLQAASLLPAADCESPMQVEVLAPAGLQKLIAQSKTVFTF